MHRQPKTEGGTIYTLCNRESTRKDGITFRPLFDRVLPGDARTLQEGREGGDRRCNVDIDDRHGLRCRKGLLAADLVSFNLGTRGALPRSRERVVILGRTHILN